MTRDEIVEFIKSFFPGEELLLLDGLESAFVGVASRFEPHQHRQFAVYDYDKIIESLVSDGVDVDDAEEWFSFNIEGAYGGETQPAILFRCATE